MLKIGLSSIDTQKCVNCGKNNGSCDGICEQENVNKQSFGEKYNIQGKKIVLTQQFRDYMDLLDLQVKGIRENGEFNAKYDKGIIN